LATQKKPGSQFKGTPPLDLGVDFEVLAAGIVISISKEKADELHFRLLESSRAAERSGEANDSANRTGDLPGCGGSLTSLFCVGHAGKSSRDYLRRDPV
jgi:hypothetical protein